MLSGFNHDQLFVTLRTVAHQAPLSVEFFGQKHWTELPCPPLGTEPMSLMCPALASRFFTTHITWEALCSFNVR